jgi:hypothetical protein
MKPRNKRKQYSACSILFKFDTKVTPKTGIATLRSDK